MAYTSQILSQVHTNGLLESEPWPDDVTLYQPYEAEQILLPENASCLAVKAFLKLCGLPFEVRSCANAEFMSPGGRMTKLPFLRAGAFNVAEFEPIVAFVEQKGEYSTKWLDEDEHSNMRSYLCLAENIFTMAEIYISFKNKRVYDEVTAPRNGCVYPWPLNIIQNRSKRRNAMRLLKVYQWDDMNIDNVIENVDLCCQNFSMKFAESEGPFIYGKIPCELDAILFGHLYTILTTNLPNMALANTVMKHERLTEFCRVFDEKYFPAKSS